MEQTLRRSLPFILILVIFVLLVGNGDRLFWDAVELAWAKSLQFPALGDHPLISLLYNLGLESAAAIPFFRILPVLSFICTLLLFYQLGRRLFGSYTVVFATIFVATNLVLLNGARFLTGEALLLPFQVLAFLLLITYVKRSSPSGLLGLLGVMVLLTLLQPISTVPYLMVSVGLIIWGHPKGKALLRILFLVPFLGIIGLGVWISFQYDYSRYFGMGLGVQSLNYYFLLLFLSVLPWLGFLMAGFRDIWLRFRVREEMTLWLVIWLAGAVLSFSYLPFFVLSLIAGRQARYFLGDKYPYEKFVRAGFVLQMVAAAFIAILAIISIFRSFGMPGFRGGMLTFGFYWMASLLAVIGLLLKRPPMWFFSGVLAVLLGSAAFWSLVQPRVEFQRKTFLSALTESSELAPLNIPASVEEAYGDIISFHTSEVNSESKDDKMGLNNPERMQLSDEKKGFSNEAILKVFPLNTAIRVDTLWLLKELE